MKLVMVAAYAVLAALAACPQSSHAASAPEHVIIPSMNGTPDGLMLLNKALYGSTLDGVASYGSVYMLKPPSASVDHWSFGPPFVLVFSGTDGAYIAAPLTPDRAGNLFGDTFGGGGNCGSVGCGTLFKLTPPSAPSQFWSKATIYSFTTPVQPKDKLAVDASGNLYLPAGSSVEKFAPPKKGATAYVMSTIYTDASSQTISGLVTDAAGALYGVAAAPTTSSTPTDFVYKLIPPSMSGGTWTRETIQTFDADTAVGQIFISNKGAILGTTTPASPGQACSTTNCAVFELRPPAGSGSWTEVVLHSFTGDPLGAPVATLPSTYPTVGVREDALSFGPNGTIYGAITPGTANPNSTIYRLSPPTAETPSWTETPLYTFQDTASGLVTGTPMVVTGTGVLYGTANYNAFTNPSHNGVVFRIGPN